MHWKTKPWLKLIPRGAHIYEKQLLLSKASDQLSVVTGLVRRPTCPFICVCIQGLNTNLTSDTDRLVQKSLELIDIYSKLLGTNEDASAIHRSESWIKAIQKQCFEVGPWLEALFNTNINTKVLRFIRNVEAYVKSFSKVRWGPTDKNESQHKSLKTA